MHSRISAKNSSVTLNDEEIMPVGWGPARSQLCMHLIHNLSSVSKNSILKLNIRHLE
jgi:hypothetical protein